MPSLQSASVAYRRTHRASMRVVAWDPSTAPWSYRSRQVSSQHRAGSATSHGSKQLQYFLEQRLLLNAERSYRVMDDLKPALRHPAASHGSGVAALKMANAENNARTTFCNSALLEYESEDEVGSLLARIGLAQYSMAHAWQSGLASASTALACDGAGSEDAHERMLLAQRLQLWSNNIDLLQVQASEGSLQRVAGLVCSSPVLLDASPGTLHVHCTFFRALGVQPDTLEKVLRECPELALHGCVHTAGRAMLLFRSLGWRHADVVSRIIGLYPQLLMLDVSRDMQPVLEYLEEVGVQGEQLRLLVWEYPRIFSKDHRRQVRKFMYLGQYGLSLPARNVATAP